MRASGHRVERKDEMIGILYESVSMCRFQHTHKRAKWINAKHKTTELSWKNMRSNTITAISTTTGLRVIQDITKKQKKEKEITDTYWSITSPPTKLGATTSKGATS